jgi:hypothetical protein
LHDEFKFTLLGWNDFDWHGFLLFVGSIEPFLVLIPGYKLLVTLPNIDVLKKIYSFVVLVRNELHSHGIISAVIRVDSFIIIEGHIVVQPSVLDQEVFTYTGKFKVRKWCKFFFNYFLLWWIDLLLSLRWRR